MRDDDARAEPERLASGRPQELLPGHRLISITGGSRWTQAEAFLYDIYLALGWCEESPRQRVEKMARWDDRSRFHAVVGRDDEIVGLVRAIFGPYDALPVGQFTRTDFDDRDPVCELASLTVTTHMRSTGVIEHLYRAGWIDALVSGANALVALTDRWLFDLMQLTYCLPFRVVGVAETYMGSYPMPVSMPTCGDAFWSTAERNPGFYAWGVEPLAPGDVERFAMPILGGRSPDHGAPNARRPVSRRSP